MSSLTKQAYRQIQDRIVSGQLPAGSLVSESALAKELGMSRTPVGEAIRQLATEGLVEQLPRRGTIVRGVDRDDLRELFEIREALESYAAAQAAERISPTQLAQLEALCNAMRDLAEQVRATGAAELNASDLKTFLSADMAFHLLILQASGNQRMQRSVSETRAVSSIFRMRRQRHDLQVLEQAHAEHAEILAALARGDAEAARAQMAAHIAASKQSALAELERQAADQSVSSLLSDLPQDLVQELERIETEGS